MQQGFIHTIKSYTDLPYEEEEKILRVLREKTLKKGAVFIKEGQIPRKFGFVIKGLFRYYYINDKGNECTKGFFPESTFLSSYSAMIQNRASYFTIEALEDSICWVIDYHQWQTLYRGHPCWSHLLVKLLEHAFCMKETRERELLLFDAEKRYKLFLQNYPGLTERVKQHIIASYLRITPVALSRLRKNMGLLT